jgi:dolichyl-phosphate-mannose--protein O-mannosyl transferase
MRFDGLTVGVITFLIIGIFHPIVVKGEYYFTEKIWPLFLLAGIAALALSCFVRQIILSSVLGVLGCTCLWSILELKEQTKRVEKGWFPRNPKRNPLGIEEEMK